MNRKIFISYAHKDSKAAKDLAKELGAKGIQTWFDENELKSGESWNLAIKNAMDASETVVVILGEDEPSPHVLVEAGMALAQGKQIIPVVLGEHANTGIFKNIQQIRVLGENGIEIVADKIVDSISEHERIIEPGKFGF